MGLLSFEGLKGVSFVGSIRDFGGGSSIQLFCLCQEDCA